MEGNVLIENFEKENQRAVICDFGLARIVNMASDYKFVASLKEPSLDGLTPIYASPEVTRENLY